LFDLGRAYDVSFSSLFEPELEAETLVVVRATDGTPQRGNGLSYKRLLEGGWTFNLQPLQVVVAVKLREG
jgi:hypothetical protein